jgi:hypothetical protein
MRMMLALTAALAASPALADKEPILLRDIGSFHIGGRHGGSVDLIDLPDIGIKGNTHMVMMDRNSDEVADVIRKRLASRNLSD